MKTISRILICVVLMGLFCGILLPCVNADVFDIGTKISESDLTTSNTRYYYFDSGSMLYTKPDYIDYAPSLFDNNESTGIDHNFGPGHADMILELMFPSSYYVSNITVKPAFGGGATNYSLYISAGNVLLTMFAQDISIQKTFQINGKIKGIRLWLDNDGTNHFYFNDVIINYTSTPSNIDEVIQELNNLTTKIDSLESQLSNLTAKYDSLNNMTNKLNTTINNMNLTQQQILENITNLWSFYNLLNESIMNIINDIDNLNMSTSENITNLWTTYTQLNESFTNIIEELENLNLTTHENITKIENDFYDIYRFISDLTTNVTELLKIQDQIDETTLTINNLNDNVTDVKNSIPDKYNDTGLNDRISELETENSGLNTKLAKLNSDIANLTSELENIEPTEIERVIEKEADNSVVYGAVIFGIIGIVIALIALALIFKRTKSPPSVPEEQVPPVPSVPPPPVEQAPQVEVQEPAVAEPPAELQQAPVPNIKTEQTDQEQ